MTTHRWKASKPETILTARTTALRASSPFCKSHRSVQIRSADFSPSFLRLQMFWLYQEVRRSRQHQHHRSPHRRYGLFPPRTSYPSSEPVPSRRNERHHPSSLCSLEPQQGEQGGIWAPSGLAEVGVLFGELPLLSERVYVHEGLLWLLWRVRLRGEGQGVREKRVREGGARRREGEGEGGTGEELLLEGASGDRSRCASVEALVLLLSGRGRIPSSLPSSIGLSCTLPPNR
jgi:hypothetical protein